MTAQQHKRKNGIYYTTGAAGNPFEHPAFRMWVSKHIRPQEVVLEPFAGAMYIKCLLHSAGYSFNFAAYDLNPQNPAITKQDTIQDFPAGYNVVITNPPYLAKNSATRRGFSTTFGNHDNLYKYALQLCLQNTKAVAVIIPDSFITSGLFQNRLEAVISLNYQVFDDTDCPVCLALFSPNETNDFDIYLNEEYLGKNSDYQSLIPAADSNDIQIKFDDPDGQLSVKLCDNTKNTDNICFLPDGAVKADKSTRGSSRIGIYYRHKKVEIDQLHAQLALTNALQKWREETNDIFLTSFHGLRQDGRYRKRISYEIIRSFLTKYTNNILHNKESESEFTEIVTNYSVQADKTLKSIKDFFKPFKHLASQVEFLNMTAA